MNWDGRELYDPIGNPFSPPQYVPSYAISDRWQCNLSLGRFKGYIGCWDGIEAYHPYPAFGGESVVGGAGNYNRSVAPPQPTFPPRARFGAASSLSLLAQQGSDRPPPKVLPDRPLLDETIDLITGGALLQEVDMELPFGGALFRHVRTYADTVPASSALPTLGWSSYDSPPIDADRVWDWQGIGWMMSESPLLLVDAGTPDAVPASTRRTWLVLDAHHSIPFDFEPNTGRYICPPRFDARLEHDGAWPGAASTQTQNWWADGPWTGASDTAGAFRRPRWFRVWLQSDTICLTFWVDWSDMPQSARASHASFHRVALDGNGGPVRAECPPDGARFDGLPYFGYLTQIADTRGHRVELEVAGVPASVGGAGLPAMRAVELTRVETDQSQNEGSGCACVQGCAERGQVRSARLWRRDRQGNDVCDWTLAYVYRNFWQLTEEWPLSRESPVSSLASRSYTSNSLHALYAYRGDRLGEFPAGPMVIEGKYFLLRPRTLPTGGRPAGAAGPWSGSAMLDDPLFPRLGPVNFDDRPRAVQAVAQELALVASYDEADQVIDPATLLGLPAGWEKRTRYTYGEDAQVWTDDYRAVGWLAGLTSSHGPWIVDCAGPAAGRGGGVWKYGNQQVGGPRLIRVQRTTRGGPAPAALAESSEDTLYRYKRMDPHVEEMHLTQVVPPVRVSQLLQQNWPADSGSMFDGIPLAVAGRPTVHDLFRVSDAALIGNAEGGSDPRSESQGGLVLTYGRRSVAASQEQEARALLGLGFSGNNQGLTVPEAGLTEYQRDGRKWLLYHYLCLPTNAMVAGDDNRWNVEPGHSLFHHPHAWRGRWLNNALWTDGMPPGQDDGDLANATWGTVAVTASVADRPRTARVVQCNRAGDILLDQTYTDSGTSPGGWSLSSQQGSSEVREYEAYGGRGRRLAKIKGAGWSAANAASPASGTGLVTWFTYASDVADDPASLVVVKVEVSNGDGTNARRVSVKELQYLAGTTIESGGESGVVPANRYVHVDRTLSEPGRADKPARWLETRTNYRFVLDPSVLRNGEVLLQAAPRLIMQEAVRGKTMQPDGTERSAIIREAFDEYGRRTHLLRGSIARAEPFAAAVQGDDVALDWVRYNGQGWAEVSIVDARMDGELSHTPAPRLGGVAVPGGWAYAVAGPIVSPRSGNEMIDDQAFHLPGPVAHERQHLVTAQYVGSFGQEWVVHPNGLADITRYDEKVFVPIGGPTITAGRADIPMMVVSAFKGLASTMMSEGSGPGAAAGTGGPAEEQHIVEGQVRESKTGTWPSTTGDTLMLLPTRTTTFQYDAAGRPVGARVFVGDDAAERPLVQAQGTRDTFGGFEREQVPDGTITRTLRDALGRVWRTYRGTADIHPFWQTGNAADNMVIAEERFYADAVHPLALRNVGKLLRIDHFTDLDGVAQYVNGGPAAAAAAPAGPPTWSEHFEYDIQMRQVIVRKSVGRAGPLPGGGRGSAGSVFETTATWLDQAGRARLVARFGPGTITHLGALSPAEAEIGAAPPTAEAILSVCRPSGNASPAMPASLVSLSETTYNLRGLPEEQRSYILEPGLLSPSDAAHYTATITYYDHEDRPIWVESPGAGVRRTLYDALGRELSAAMGVECDDAGVPARGTGKLRELTRTDTVYDADGNPLRTVSRERLHDAPRNELVLGPGNSIASYSFNWYDANRRLIATADVGANPGVAAANTYTPGIELGAGEAIDPDKPPTWSGGAPGAGAYVYTGCWSTSGSPGTNPPPSPFDSRTRTTLYTYDDQGRQTSVRGPDGSLTRHVYDALNNIVLTTENADAHPSQQRRTAYDYRNGQLQRIAAVLPGHALTTPPEGSVAPATASWPADLDGGAAGLQITRLHYGADIVDHGFNAVGRSNGLVGRVSFPGRTGNGGPDSTGDLWFNYTFDDQVATRRDARGHTFRYRYDAARRLASIEVGGTSVDAESGAIAGFVPGYLPSEFAAALTATPRVAYVQFAYNERGLLADARAYDRRTGQLAALAHTRSEYDVRGNLVKEYQFVGGEMVDTRDYNLDGAVNPDDLGDFVTCYFDEWCQFDYNGDGSVNSDDLGDFITNYNGPAPQWPFATYAWSPPAGLTPRPASGTWPLGENRPDRLTGIIYPRHQNLAVPMGQRVVALGYGGVIPGTAGSGSAGKPDDDSIFSRITSMEQSPDSLTASSNLARFAYAGGAGGGGRRRGTWMGVVGAAFALGQTVAALPTLPGTSPPVNSPTAVPGLPGLDRYGRLADLHYQTAAYSTTANGTTTHHADTLYRARMTHDAAGNRLAANITQAPVAVSPTGGGGGGSVMLQPNTRSQLNGYDGLSRLTGSSLGVLQVDTSGYAALASGSGMPVGLASGGTLRSDAWTLDTLGNWVGGAAAGVGGAGVPGSTAPGRAVSGVGEWGLMEGEPEDASSGGGGGSPTGATSSTFTQSVNPRNEIIDIVRTQTGGGSGSGGGSGGGGAGTGGGALTLPPQHDGVGNLIYDGRFIYHYDAWNRLVQVNKAVVEMVDAGQGTGDPEPDPQARLAAGPLVKQYVYDALGRLVETRTPIAASNEPPAQAGGQGANVIAPGPDGSATPLLAERFSYDGVRRIQETSEVRAAVNPPTPPEGSGGGGGSGSGGGTSWTGSTPPGEVVDGSRRFEREYIWGPGDGHAGVDELLALFEGARATEFAAAANSVPSGSGGTPEEQAEARLAAQQAVSLAAQSKPWWVIQDASGDVVALCDNGGPSAPTGLSPTGAGGGAIGPATTHTARVVQQWTYDAYGAVLAAEQVVSDPNVVIPNLRVGHKGLFVDRLDVGITTSGTDPPSGLANLDTSSPARLVRHAAVLYHVRNRIYLPALGVWAQRDPNGTGQQTVASTAYHGVGIGQVLGGFVEFSATAHYGNGLNVLAYLGGSPLGRFDSLGLAYDPFDAVDDYLAEDAGSKAAFMASIVRGFNTSAHIAWSVAQMYPPIGIAAAGFQIATGNITAGSLLAIVPGGAAAKVAAKAYGALGAARTAYAATGRVGRGIGLVGRAASQLPADFHAGERIYKVYVGYRDGKAAYVGLTKDIIRRQAEWKGKYELKEMFSDLTLKQARAIETRYMIVHRAQTADNKILSIAADRAWFDEAMEWAAQFVP